jgi:5,10-methylenetetrahydrofolate reductase
MKTIAQERADWLVDAVAMATQNRALLRGDPAEDKVLTEALYINAVKAIEAAIERDIAAERADMHSDFRRSGDE